MQCIKELAGQWMDVLRSCSRDIRSKGLWPQLVCCAPFPSTALYFRVVYVVYLKIHMTIV